MNNINLDTVKTLFKNITKYKVLVAGSIVQILVLTPLNILIGRFVGPTDYGEYTFMISVSTILSVFLTFGQQSALINYLSPLSDDERENIISSHLVLLLLITIITIGTFLIYSNIHDYSMLKSVLIILHAIMLAMIAINQSVYQSLLRFKMIGLFKFLFPLAFSFGIISFFILNERRSANIIILIRSFSILVSIIFFLSVWIRKYFRFINISFNTIKQLLKYGLHGLFITVVATIVLQSDKLFIDKFLNRTILGYYQAYFQATISFFQFFAMLSAIVFFPIYKRKTYFDRAALIKKITMYSPMLMVLGILFTPISLIIVSLYGPEYFLSWKILLGMNIAGVTLVLHSLFSRAVLSNDIKGARAATINTIVSALVFFLIIFLSISHIKVYGVILAIFAYNTVGVLINYIAIRKLNHR